MSNEGEFKSKKSCVFVSNLFVFIIMFLSMCYQFILLFFQHKIPNSATLNILICFILPQIFFLLFPTIAYFKITKKPIRKVLRLNKISFKTFLITLVILFLYEYIGSFISLLTLYIFPSEKFVIEKSLIGVPLLFKICIIALMPAIFEEIAIRGVALFGYNGISIVKTSIIIGFFFGVLHRNGNQFAYAFIIGIILVYLVRITNSIIPAILYHFIHNAISTVSYHYFSPQYRDFNSVIVTSINNLILYFVLSIICAILIKFLMLKLSKINNYSDTKQVVEFKKTNSIHGKIKIVNWPFVGLVLMGIFSIGFQLFMLYIVK